MRLLGDVIAATVRLAVYVTIAFFGAVFAALFSLVRGIIQDSGLCKLVTDVLNNFATAVDKLLLITSGSDFFASGTSETTIDALGKTVQTVGSIDLGLDLNLNQLSTSLSGFDGIWPDMPNWFD